MNQNRKLVRVPPSYVARGRQFGSDLVAHYAAGGSPQSRARSGDRGTEANPILQAQGKIGEIATAIYFGLDVETSVKWDISRPDPGFDITLRSGLRLDAKTTLPPFKLCWSRHINDLYWQKQFDALVAVSIEERDWSCCHIEGWISKGGFFYQKQIANGANCGLERGTWFVDKAILSNISDLPYVPILQVVIQRETAA
ncbi:hypothetical protein A1D31_22510 [Bradyrhizobium liaoningense]|nr:hypothetical protein A1D31_22510 [Bradyrhizobium liaoningense]